MEDNKELFTAEGFRKDSLEHHGVKGQKWGKRRYQNKDGSLTPLGYKHWGIGTGFKDKVSKVIETSKQNREQKSYERDVKQAEKAQKQLEENARKREIQELKNQAAATKRETKQLKNVERQIKKDERAAKKEARDTKKIEKKKEELLKNDDLDEILKNKDIFSTAELNNIYMKKMAEQKVADMKPKTWSQKFADKFSVDNIANVAQKAQKMYNAYDTISTVVNKAVGSTVLPEMGYKVKEQAKAKEKEEKLKKLRTYTINDIEKNLADISTEELMDWNKRANVLNRYSPGSMMKDAATTKETKAHEDVSGSIKKTATEAANEVSRTISDVRSEREARASERTTAREEKEAKKAEKAAKKAVKEAKKEKKAEEKAAKKEAKEAEAAVSAAKAANEARKNAQAVDRMLKSQGYKPIDDIPKINIDDYKYTGGTQYGTYQYQGWAKKARDKGNDYVQVVRDKDIQNLTEHTFEEAYKASKELLDMDEALKSAKPASIFSSNRGKKVIEQGNAWTESLSKFYSDVEIVDDKPKVTKIKWS